MLMVGILRQMSLGDDFKHFGYGRTLLARAYRALESLGVQVLLINSRRLDPAAPEPSLPDPDMAYDCGKPRGWIKAVAWAGGEKKWPKAYEAIRRFTMDNETMGNLIVQVDLENREVDQVVQEWLEQNEATWKPWTE
jgi:hypothetical protein